MLSYMEVIELDSTKFSPSSDALVNYKLSKKD